jgi:hypothetical protein
MLGTAAGAAGSLLPAFTPDLPTDSRKNVVAYTQFETRWAVSVLTSAAQPNDKLAKLVADLPEWQEMACARTGMDALHVFYADLIERGFLSGEKPGVSSGVAACCAVLQREALRCAVLQGYAVFQFFATGFTAAIEAFRSASTNRNRTKEMIALISGAADPPRRLGAEFKDALDEFWAVRPLLAHAPTARAHGAHAGSEAGAVGLDACARTAGSARVLTRVLS